MPPCLRVLCFFAAVCLDAELGEAKMMAVYRRSRSGERPSRRGKRRVSPVLPIFAGVYRRVDVGGRRGVRGFPRCGRARVACRLVARIATLANITCDLLSVARPLVGLALALAHTPRGVIGASHDVVNVAAWLATVRVGWSASR